MKIRKTFFQRMGWVILGLGTLAAINFIPMASTKTRAMNSYVFSGIPCYAEEQDKEEAAILAETIADHSEPITQSLGENLARDIEIIVYPSHKALHRKTIGFAGIFLPDWYIGNNTQDLVQITSPRNPGPSHSREAVIQAAVHEYVHLLTDRKNIKMDLWLKEGFAVYLSKQQPNRMNITQAMDLTIEEFNTRDSLNFSKAGGYYMAHEMMVYLEETYGWDSVLSFLEPGSSFKSVTGLNKEAFLTQWKVWMKKRYS